jgi:hypothetical protein
VGLLGSQTALYMQDVAKDAYRRGKLGMIGNVDTYSSQNVQTTPPARATTPRRVTKGAANSPPGPRPRTPARCRS